MYVQTVRPIVQSAMRGYNATVFAYGQTSSGKTHTIWGKNNCPGVIMQAVEDVFDAIDNVR